MLIVANKVDVDIRTVSRRYGMADKIGAEIEFVSAARGDNVVAIFEKALEMGLNYK